MINFNGNIIEENEFFIDHNNRYLTYGDGFFETIKIINGKPKFWNDHYFRIVGSLCMLRIPIPSFFNSNFLLKNINDLLNSNNLLNSSCRLKIIFFRNSKGFYLPKTNIFSFLISTDPLDNSEYNINTKDLSVDLFSQYKLGTSELNNLKSTNRLINVLASMYYNENNLDDSILINEKNYIVEFTSGNLFIILDGKIITPPLESGCINGVLRKKIIEFESLFNMKIEESNIKTKDLYNAQELFSTNVIYGIRFFSNFRNKKYENYYSRLIIERLNKII
tara:strand:+ start:297 stop:1130 length:834 start_codon:yes stop_codon:yes gene_type:complete